MYPSLNQFLRWASQYKAIPVWMEPELPVNNLLEWVHNHIGAQQRLFLLQSGQRERDFQGRLQLVVNVVERGATRALVVPAESERDARDHQLKFRFFQRVEGTFRVHPDAAVKSVQLRVYEQGSKAPKLAQTVNVT